MEIRFLLNYQMDSMSPMALILVGQNELWDKFKLLRYAAIRQRIDIKCEIPQYDRAQVGEYISRHMEYAGCDREVFNEKAIDEVYKYSAGSARAINKLCNRTKTKGVIMCEQVKALDLSKRNATFLEKAPADIISDAVDMIFVYTN